MSSSRRTDPFGDRPAALEFTGTARFEVRRRIGEGSMGAVYLVVDRDTGREVALKTLRRVDASGIYRFKREFRALSDMSHKNLVKLHELFSENDEWFFTMEFVEGSFFLDHVLGRRERRVVSTPRSTPDMELPEPGALFESLDLQVRGLEMLFPTPLQDETRLRDVLRQIAEGLLAVHAAGKLHRDLKSENVLVTQEGRAVLLDFGIAAERVAQLHGTLDVGVLGTPAYMSPEQAAGLPVDEATDWYSLGVMLYEALTGSVPFEGTYLQIIQQKQHLDPLPPSQIVSGIPIDLNDLCVQLLTRDPAQRPRGDAVIRALQQKRAASMPPPKMSMAAEPQPPLLGRETQLELLTRALGATDDGRPVLAFVHGDSGMGKTALVDAFITQIRQEREAVVLKGVCYERESVPFKAFDSLVDSLCRYLRRLSPVRAAELLPRDAPALAQLFPVLKRVEVFNEMRRRGSLPSDPHELRRRAFSALKELFARIADQQPLVLFIDDLQWGDVDSARLIADLTGSSESPALLCICAYRSGEVLGSPCLQALFSHTREDSRAEVREIHVGALSLESSYALARELLGQDAWQAARAIGNEAQGSPFLLTELVRYVERATTATSEAPAVVSLQEALAERLDSLSSDARELLMLISVAGRPMPEPMLSLVGTFDIDLQSALAELRSARLVRGVATRAVRAVDVYHDRIRQSVLARVPEAALAQCHRRLAATLEASGSVDLEALAEHLLGAGEVTRGGLYARRAAEQAVAALAFEKAARLYAVAAEHDACVDIERAELLAAWGDALVNAGRALRAAEVYSDACGYATAQQIQVLRRKAGIELLRSGYFERGLATLQSTLQAEGIVVPETFSAALREAQALRRRLRERGLVFARRSPKEIAPEALERVDLLFSVTIGLLLTNIERTLPLCVLGVLEALEVGEPARVARALCLFHVYVDAGICEAFGEEPLGALDAAGSLASYVDDPTVRAWLFFARGNEAMRRGEIAPALRLIERAEETFRNRCTGSAAEMRLCRQLLASMFAYDAEHADLGKCEEWVREAEDHEDHVGATRLRLLGTTLSLMRDDDERAERSEQAARASLRPRPEFDLTSFVHQVSSTQLELYRGDGRACLALAKGFVPFFSSALASVPLWRAQCHLLRALLFVRASTAADLDTDSLANAEAELDAAECAGLPCLVQSIKLLRATVEAMRMHAQGALRLLDEILETPQPFTDAKLVLAVARLRKGELLGGSEGEALVLEADASLRHLGVKNPERYARLYSPMVH